MEKKFKDRDHEYDQTIPITHIFMNYNTFHLPIFDHFSCYRANKRSQTHTHTHTHTLLISVEIKSFHNTKFELKYKNSVQNLFYGKCI